jgi:uncharacterized membrane protein
MWFVGLLLGMVSGALFGRHDAWFFGGVLGALLGWAFSQRRQAEAKLGEKLATLEGEVRELRRRLGVVETHLSAPPPVVAPASTTQAAAASEAASANAAHPEAAPPTPGGGVGGNAKPPAAAEPRQRIPPESASARRPPAYAAVSAIPTAPAPLPEPNVVMQWLLGGNTVVRLGIVILFFGVAFLLKYAYEHTQVPLEVRLFGVALGAAGLLTLGWRLREARSGYALALQGGGIGVLYLTIFAAFRLYALLPPGPAFALLVAIAVFSALLALWQDSLALAAIGVSGGFLAPILASTGQGSHIMLFSYYLVLNLGIVAIAWHKAWRVLNLLGFAFTAGIGALWGARSYRPEFFASTELFLVTFFLLYVAISVLYARRQSFALRHYVDGTLVFGVPLVAFGLQTGLMREFEYGAAWSALALGAFYVVLASAMWRRAGDNLRLLCESCLALGIGFGTLAIPLAFDGRLTSAAWALEGAAIVWVSVRQGRKLARALGLLLQLAAGVAFVYESVWGSDPAAVPLLNSYYLGCFFIAAGGLFCSAYLDRHHEQLQRWEQDAATILLGWGLLWWVGGGLHEIDRHIDWALRSHAGLLFLAASALACSLLSTRLTWAKARWPAYLVVPIAALALFEEFDHWRNPFANFGWFVWPATFAAHLAVLRRHEPQDADLHGKLHAGGLWLMVIVVSAGFAWQIDQAVDGKRVWPLIAWALIPALSLAALTAEPVRRHWPLAGHARSYLQFGAAPLAIFLGAWTIYANFSHNGDPFPLPFVPLLNPLDLAQALAFVIVAFWLLTLRRLDYVPSGGSLAVVYALFGAALFIWANGALVRTLHHWADIPFRLDAMLRSVLVQAAFSLFWSLLALGLMVAATRRAWRDLWILGAVLMGVVVGKLFLVDLSNAGTVERIVSFIGVGTLLLVIGYFSPVPPRDAIEGKP